MSTFLFVYSVAIGASSLVVIAAALLVVERLEAKRRLAWLLVYAGKAAPPPATAWDKFINDLAAEFETPAAADLRQALSLAPTAGGNDEAQS